MTIKVALLRGINVGGKNSLPMRALRELLGEIGCHDISTYIQSGNVVFKSNESVAALSKRLPGLIEKRFGFEPFVLILTGDVLTEIAAANPYSDDDIEPKFVHVNFLARKSKEPDVDGLRERQSTTEHFTLTDHALYLRAPEGIGRSRFAADAEKLLGVPTTGRNWKTVCKLVEMVAALA